MVRRGEITDQAWQEIEPLLPEYGQSGGQWRDHRTVINGILWKLRTGSPWRDLPERAGRYLSGGHCRSASWQSTQLLEELLDAVRLPRPEHSPGRPRKRPAHLYSPTGATASKVVEGCCVGAASPTPSRSEEDQKERREGHPGRRPGFDREAYRRRNVVERCVNRLKQWRAIATRYEKRAVNYRAMVVT